MGFCIFKGACVGGVEFYLCVLCLYVRSRVCACVELRWYVEVCVNWRVPVYCKC